MSEQVSCCAAHYYEISNQRKRESRRDTKDTDYSSVTKRSQGTRFMTGVSHLKKAE